VIQRAALSLALLAMLSCSSEPRKADPPDSGDTDSDTGTQPAWSAPGWEMSWVVRAGGQEPYQGGPGDKGLGSGSSPDGGVFVCGYLFSEDALFGEGTYNEVSFLPPEEGVVFLSWYNEDGVPAWVSRAGTTGVGAYSCAATEDGGAVIAGSLEVWNHEGGVVFGEGEPSETALSLECDRSAFIGKYRGDGGFEWVTAANGQGGYGMGLGVAVATNGDVCLSGIASEPFTFRDDWTEIAVLVEDPGTDAFLARFSKAGVPLWVRQILGPGGDNMCWDVVALPDGSCAVTCWYSGTTRVSGGSKKDVTFELSDDQSGNLVAVYSPEGDLEWAVDLGIRGNRLPDVGLAADFDSSLIAGGSFDGTLTVGGIEVPAQGADLFLSRLSPTGEILWTSVVQGPDESSQRTEGIHSVSISPEGLIAVAGAFSGVKTFGAGEPHETTLVSAAEWSAKMFSGFVALYSPEGFLHWAIPVGSGPGVDDSCSDNWGEQRAHSVSFAGTDTLYITGSFLKDATFGTSPESMVTLQPYGCADMFLMKLERIEAPR
jgi:hypothetical protein